MAARVVRSKQPYLPRIGLAENVFELVALIDQCRKCAEQHGDTHPSYHRLNQHYDKGERAPMGSLRKSGNPAPAPITAPIKTA